jgi:hypothetical protein
LFIARIAGNIVVVVAHYITGGLSRNGPLLAVPIFIIVLGTVVWGIQGQIEASNVTCIADSVCRASDRISCAFRHAWPLR